VSVLYILMSSFEWNPLTQRHKIWSQETKYPTLPYGVKHTSLSDPS